jgi:hypothetical protein
VSGSALSVSWFIARAKIWLDFMGGKRKPERRPRDIHDVTEFWDGNTKAGGGPSKIGRLCPLSGHSRPRPKRLGWVEIGPSPTRVGATGLHPISAIRADLAPTCQRGNHGTVSANREH